MKPLTVLKIAFDTNLENREIPSFHTALEKYLGLPESKQGEYPLLQSKTRMSANQQQPFVVCLEPIFPHLHKMGQGGGENIDLGSQKGTIKIAHTKATVYELRVKKRMIDYQLYRYQAMPPTQLQSFLQLGSKVAQCTFLEDCIRNHLRHFANAIQWNFKKEWNLKVLDILRLKPFRNNGVTSYCFDIRFQCQLFLPEYISLGNGGVQNGFGVLRKPRRIVA